MRAAVAQLFLKGLAHAVDIAVLTEDEGKDDPVVARAYLSVRAVITHEGATGPGGRIWKMERNRMTLGGVSAGAMTYVTRGEQSALEDGLRRFAHDHAVHDDQVAGFQIDERQFLLCGNVLGGRDCRAGCRAEANSCARSDRSQGDEDVVAWIDLKGNVGH